MWVWWGDACALGIALLFVASAATAQTTGGALLGRVSDERDQVLAGAEITAIHVPTGLTRTLHSASDGRFRFPSLPTGSYELTAAMPGFTTVSVRKIDLLLGVARHVDIRLRRVTEKEDLTVTAPVRVVESGPAINVIVQRDLVADVPLRRRSADELASLAPLANPALQHPLAETIVDGAIVVADPPLDAIEQLNATTRQYSAEYGRTSGGVLLVAPRKGANEVEGDAFAFHRNVRRQWQWGAAAGGPIVKETAHAFGALERDTNQPDRLFATANLDLSSRHFVESDYTNQHDSGLLRDLWLAHRALWNELILRAASGASEVRETLAGSVDGITVRHDWTVGATAMQNGGSGYFAQDQMTVRKLVVNAGVRYDRQETSAGFSPRIGWTYDVNGSGRNLLRGSFGRYRNPDTSDASIGYSWQVNPWVALNVDGLRSSGPGGRPREAVAASGQVQFGTFVSLTGSYTYSDRVVADDRSRHSAAVAGTIHLPGGFWVSGIGRYRSASQFADRVAGTDLRVAKTFDTVHGVSVDAIADVFNAFDQERQMIGNERVGQFGLRLRF